jgi:hypothetical protein
MTDTTCQPIEAALNLPALTGHAAVLDALSQLLQAVATNQIGTRRANLLLRGLSLATRLAATLEKENEKQESAEPVSQETLSSINIMASLDEDEVKPQPTQENTQSQAVSTVEVTKPLTLREKIDARRAHISKMAMQFPTPSAGRPAPTWPLTPPIPAPGSPAMPESSAGSAPPLPGR